MEIEPLTRKNFINVQSIKMQKLKIKFNITTLDMILAFIYKPSVLRTRKALTNISKLFSQVDEKIYESNQELLDRIWVIMKSLQGILVDDFQSSDNLLEYCRSDPNCTDEQKEIIDDIPNKKISHEESKFLIKKLDDTLEFGYTVTIKDIMEEILHKIDDEDFKSYKSVQDDLYDIATAIINIKRNARSLGSDQTFSLQEEMFDTVVEGAVQRLNDRNRIFITGLQLLNAILSPGLISKRLYTFLAFPGKGKSTILLKIALDIKKYNSHIKPKDPDKRPAVLFLTLENDIPETIERIYNMTVDSDDIRNYTPKQVKRKLREEGHLKLTNDNAIDIIIKEYRNREIDTGDIYSIITDLEDEGVETIALIVDYIKRIRPAEKALTEKEELKNISNELKEIAKQKDIVVVTAQQLNRVGASVVDAAIQARKEDVTRLVGRDSIAGAWEILENSDVSIIVNPEKKLDSDELYMTFKLLKRRYRSIESSEKLRRLDYFNQPFEKGSEIRLVDDIGQEKPAGITSLATQFEGYENGDSRNAVERKEKDSDNEKDTGEKKKKDKKKFSQYSASDFSPFDMSTTVH